ncbi:hypothetical protein FGO68_gene5992 [Halteria grandinella]|uniref:PX domain-containing protein n=1 Tax=Halteria grandinella TaxID=5974 RepID=A0A8J8SUW0_HALGN|nr:hypothetical protein FGO68_gene5992 [Halteria grandinella]
MSKAHTSKTQKIQLLRAELLHEGYDPREFSQYTISQNQLPYKQGEPLLDVDLFTYNKLLYAIQEYKIFTKPNLSDAKQIEKLDQQLFGETKIAKKGTKPVEEVKSQDNILEDFYSKKNPYNNTNKIQESQINHFQNSNVLPEEFQPQRVIATNKAAMIGQTPLSCKPKSYSVNSLTHQKNVSYTLAAHNLDKGQFRITVTHPQHWNVIRIDQDFHKLTKYLTQVYPQIILPPIPNMNFNQLGSSKTCQTRAMIYERFLSHLLNECIHSELIKADQWFCDFLSIQKLTFPHSNFQVKSVKDFITEEGSILITEAVQEDIGYLNSYIKDFEVTYQSMAMRHKELRHDFANLGNTLEKISQEYKSLQVLDKHHPLPHSGRISPNRHPVDKTAQTTSQLSQQYSQLSLSYHQHPLIATHSPQTLPSHEFFFKYYALQADTLRVWYDTNIKPILIHLAQFDNQDLRDLLSVYVSEMKRQVLGEMESRRGEEYRQMLNGMRVKLMGCV